MAREEVGKPLTRRVIAVPETRQLDVLANLLLARGANVVRCPLVSIVDSPDTAAVVAWLKRLIDNPPALIVLYTGEGIERLLGFAERAGIRKELLGVLNTTRKLCRGPKPKRALRRLGLDAELEAREPTTAGVIATLEALDLDGQRIAVQLYGGKKIPELARYLAARGADVDWVAPYAYATESDDARVVELIGLLERGGIDAIAFTSQSQIERLVELARKRGLDPALATGMRKTFVAAVGPVVAEALRVGGFAVNAMPEESYFMKPLVTLLEKELGGSGFSRDSSKSRD
jgi:uroporphyrinogen-III synthase